MASRLSDHSAEILEPGSWSGLARADRALFERWLFKVHRGISRLFTGVRCGCGCPADAAGQVAGLARCADQAWSKAADVVVEWANQWWIIEVKPSASYVALGQVLVYGDLVPRRYGQVVSPRLGIVTDVGDPDCLATMRRLGVTVFELEVGAFRSLGRPS